VVNIVVAHTVSDRRGQLSFEAAMLFILGFLIVFLSRPDRHHPGSPPMDFAVSDSYFVVAHFHYVLFGTVVFCMFGGFYFWWRSGQARC